ncbi:MAG: ATP-grasp domain-containing protein [Spirochaetia bacterium]|nr:ATP-grasp domain-containing protein [Spirochaetia bacterium]
MSEELKYYISLGAGEHQKPLIEAAKKKGFLIIGVDKNINAPALGLCDLVIEESITNYRKISYKIGTSLIDGKIIGGFSASYGKALLSWAFICERYSLIGLSRTQLEIILDKLYVRKRLKQAEPIHPDFYQPDFSYYTPLGIRKANLDAMGYPAIIKTRHGFAKKNIFRVENFAEIKSILTKKFLSEKNIPNQELLIEKFIEGDEITVTGLVQNFNFQIICVSDKITSDSAPYIETEHRFPSKYTNQKKIIEEIHQKLVDILGVSDSPLVSEWKIKNGEFYLIEISPQIPGEFLGSFLIPKGLNYDFFKNLVKLTIGENIEPVKIPSKPNKVAVKYFINKPSPDEWNSLKEKALFSLVLNENISENPQNNNERYGVMGFVEKGEKIKLNQ